MSSRACVQRHLLVVDLLRSARRFCSQLANPTWFGIRWASQSRGRGRCFVGLAQPHSGKCAQANRQFPKAPSDCKNPDRGTHPCGCSQASECAATRGHPSRSNQLGKCFGTQVRACLRSQSKVLSFHPNKCALAHQQAGFRIG